MVEGILPLWKEKGMTSFDCVYKVRKILGIKKMGHSGTLDPDVEGVLPIAIGNATKVLEYMLEADKIYEGEVTIGYSTSTEDASGEIIEQVPVDKTFAEETVDEILQTFAGKIEQVPPMYSAVKVKGKRLYEYAYEGIEVERPARTVEIYSIQRTSDIQYDTEEKTARFSFETACSKGTYIRTLAVDVANKLGYPGHMSQLTRIQSGEIKAEQTATLKELKKIVSEERLNDFLLPIDYALKQFSSLDISDELWNRVKNGALLNEDDLKSKEFPVVLRYKNTVVALYDKHPTKVGLLKPKKMFKIEL